MRSRSSPPALDVYRSMAQATASPQPRARPRHQLAHRHRWRPGNGAAAAPGGCPSAAVRRRAFHELALVALPGHERAATPGLSVVLAGSGAKSPKGSNFHIAASIPLAVLDHPPGADHADAPLRVAEVSETAVRSTGSPRFCRHRRSCGPALGCRRSRPRSLGVPPRLAVQVEQPDPAARPIDDRGRVGRRPALSRVLDDPHGRPGPAAILIALSTRSMSCSPNPGSSRLYLRSAKARIEPLGAVSSAGCGRRSSPRCVREHVRVSRSTGHQGRPAPPAARGSSILSRQGRASSRDGRRA